MSRHDVVVVGGGILGLSTARALGATRPDLDIVVVEKESELAQHQTGRNSGVIHAGLYYAPGSLKAQFGVEGNRMMKRFCADNGIAVNQCGKVVVASDAAQLPALDELERRSEANGVTFSRIGLSELAEREPYVAGIDALWVADTAVVDFGEVAQRYAAIAAEAGAEIRTGFEAVAAYPTDGGGIRLESPVGAVSARVLVNCAGLHVDKIAAMTGYEPELQIIPFRGEYLEITGGSAELVRGLVYPVPDPRFPFLGVHFTRNIHGKVEVGPNAVLALAREGYQRSKLVWPELRETLAAPGFRSLAKMYWRTGAAEMWRSLSKRDFLRDARRLLPGLRREDLGAFRSGIRAQAVGPTGELIKDFVIHETNNAVHVLNAPSPAATASLAIGDHIASLTLPKLG